MRGTSDTRLAGFENETWGESAGETRRKAEREMPNADGGKCCEGHVRICAAPRQPQAQQLQQPHTPSEAGARSCTQYRVVTSQSCLRS